MPADDQEQSLPSTVTLAELFAEDGATLNEAAPYDVRTLLGVADVMVAVDTMSQEETLVYGRELLTGIVESGITATAFALRIEIDADTDDLPRLLGLVESIKGKHDYQA